MGLKHHLVCSKTVSKDELRTCGIITQLTQLFIGARRVNKMHTNIVEWNIMDFNVNMNNI